MPVPSGCSTVRVQASVSRMVSASGRGVSPVAYARAGSQAITQMSGSPPDQSGNAPSGTSAAATTAGSTQVMLVPSGPTASTSACIASAQVKTGSGLHAWKAPCRPSSRSLTIQAPMSRASMTCSGVSGGPGTATSPPRATRATHHGNRHV